MSRLPTNAPPLIDTYSGNPYALEKTFIENVQSLGNFSPDLIQAAWNNGVTAGLFSTVYGWGQERDPSYNFDEQELKELTVGIDQDLWGMFQGVKNQSHAFQVRDRAASIMAARTAIAEAGWGGGVANLFGAVTDPTAVATMFAGPAIVGLGAKSAVTAGRAAVMSRAGTAVSMGLANASTSAMLEGIRLANDPNATPREFFAAVLGDFAYGAVVPYSGAMRAHKRFIVGGLAQASGSVATIPFVSGDAEADAVLAEAMTGFFIGGTFNAVLPGGVTDVNMELDKVAKNAQMRADYEAIKATGATLTPEGEAHFDPIIGSAAIRRHEDNVFAAAGTDAETVNFQSVPAGTPMRKRSTGAEENVVDEVVATNQPTANQQVTNQPATNRPIAAGKPDPFELVLTDEQRSNPKTLFNIAAELAITNNTGGIAFFQRKFRIGYQKARDLVDSLVAAGVIGEPNAYNSRKAIITLEEWKNKQRLAEEAEQANGKPSGRMVQQSLADAEALGRRVDELSETLTFEQTKTDPQFVKLNDQYGNTMNDVGASIEYHAANDLAKKLGVNRDTVRFILTEHYGTGGVAFAYFGQKKMREAFADAANETKTLQTVASDLIKGDLESKGLFAEGVLNPRVSGYTEAGIQQLKEKYADYAQTIHEYMRSVAAGNQDFPLDQKGMDVNSLLDGNNAASAEVSSPKTKRVADTFKMGTNAANPDILGGPSPTAPATALDSRMRPDAKPGDIDGSGATDAPAKTYKWLPFGGRWSIAAAVGRSGNKDLTFIANLLGTDRMLKTDGMGNIGIVQQVEAGVRGAKFKSLSKLSEYQAEYQKANPGVSDLDFNELVTKTRRRLDPTDYVERETDSLLVRAAKQQSREEAGMAVYAGNNRARGWMSPDQLYRLYVEDTSVHGNAGPVSRAEFDAQVKKAKGADDTNDFNRYVVDAANAFKPTANHVTRLILRDKIDKYIADVPNGEARQREAWRGSIDSYFGGPPDSIDESEIRDAMARAVVRNGGKPGGPISTQAKIDRQQFLELMKDEGLTKAQLGRAERLVFGDPKNAGRSYRVNERTLLDETYVHQFEDGTTLAIEDFLVNDARVLAGHYAEQAYGAAGFGELARLAKLQLGLEPTSPSDLINSLAGRANGDLTNVMRIDAMVRALLGKRAIDPGNQFNQNAFSVMNAIRAFNQATFMATPTAAVQTLGDLGRAAAHPAVSLEAVRKSFPSYADFVDAAVKGKLPDDPIFNYILSQGLGTSRVTGRVVNGPSADIESLTGKIGAVENWSRKFASAMTDLSGNRVAQDFSELVVGAGVMQRLVDVAESGKPIGKEMTVIFKQHGIDEKMAERIVKQIRAHKVTRPDGKVVWPGFENWTDRVAAVKADRYIASLTSQVLNTGDMSLLPRLASHPIGKLAIQLRTYAFRSWENVTLPSMQVGATHAAKQFAIGSITGSVAYVAGVLTAAGLGAAWVDDEYLERRLSQEQILLSGFGRATWTSMMPALVDAGLQTFGYDSKFAPMRNSGIGQGAGVINTLAGNPTFAKLVSGIDSLSALRAMYDSDYDFSKQQAMSIYRTLIPNTPLIKPLFDSLKDGLPDTSQQPN